MRNVTIRAENLGKRYQLGQYVSYKTLRESLTNAFSAPFRRRRTEPESNGSDYIWALKNMSFQVEEGEVLGIIGRNGAGKTTLLKVLTRVTTPTEGYAEVRGRVSSLLEVGTGFHPELTGRENVYLNGAILGMRKKEIKRKFDEIVAFSGVEKFIDTPMKRYSSGMQVRLAFAVATHIEPDILLIDEVLAVGDYEFQQKCFGKMKEVGKQGRTILVVSHQLNNIASLCSRTILLDKGEIVMSGDTAEVLEYYISTVRRNRGEVVWEDPRTAPGNDSFRLHSVGTATADGQVTADLDINQEMVVRVSYWNLRADKRPIPLIFIKGALDEVAFSAYDLNYESIAENYEPDSPSQAGLYQSECRIPARLLNAITYTIDLNLAFRIPPEEGGLTQRNVLSFTVHNLGGEGNTWVNRPGAVRPEVSWKTKYLGALKEA